MSLTEVPTIEDAEVKVEDSVPADVQRTLAHAAVKQVEKQHPTANPRERLRFARTLFAGLLAALMGGGSRR